MSKYFVTKEEYLNAIATIELAIKNGQLGNTNQSLGIGLSIKEDGLYYHPFNGPVTTKFMTIDKLCDITFKSEQTIKEEARKNHEADLKRLQEEISKKSKEMEEIGKKLGDL